MNDITKGEAANRILSDSVFQEAVDAVAKSLVAEWGMSENSKRRDELWYQQRALTKLVENLSAYMQNGEMQKRITSEREGLFK